eukprot:COSAG02_NODE_2957_length_7667_cov_1172.088795_3_plen_108_part_00
MLDFIIRFRVVRRYDGYVGVHLCCVCHTRGPAAQGFFNECLKLADSDRNVDLYHWSSTKFSSTWYDTLSVLVAKGRAKVSVAASEADWSKRICEMQYADYEDHTVGS